ncbi:NF038130 family PEP-CTERM protein [Sodalinema gerasimenkoae]|uniref:NF038130 family PEP-CTERM protein n=1 Tax=Sodalinema gerasimenkoae TaxID=2862348 RepID=UPI00135AA245|nr:NF038130 family PEP-CTERM protein [Sodalinema gerasimenkoae]
MSGLLQKTLIGSSVIGMGVFAAVPGLAFSLTNPTLNDQPYLLYEQVGSSTVLNNNADLATLLQGDINNPGGHVELSGILGSPDSADMKNATTLSGFLNGEKIQVSSLTHEDWLNPYGGYNSFAEKWFYEAWHTQETGLQAWISKEFGVNNYFFASNIFVGIGGYARFSDPNVNYVNMANDGTISIGLAGHLKHYTGLNLSEVVRVDYAGETHYLYQMGSALASGLVNDKGEGADGRSHTGLYNLTLPGNPPVTDIPEPSTMLGLLGVAGLGLMKRRQS